MPKLLELDHDSLDNIGVSGYDLAALWDAKKDYIHIKNHYTILHDLTAQLKYLMARKEYLAWKRLKLYKNSVIREFENKLYRFWNDSKTGTEFKNGDRFEPHQLTVVKNRILWDGMGRFSELITGETSVYVSQMLAGKGVSDTTMDQPELEIEIARADIIRDGDANADGNVIKWSAPFGPGVPSNNVSEFGATDSTEYGPLFFRVVIQSVTEQLPHVQNVTFVQASHSVVQVSISDKIA